MSDLRKLLDDLICQAQMDAEEEWEDYSPATNSIRNTIIERYDIPSLPRSDDPMPVFVIKARDRLAIPAIRHYRNLCLRFELNEQAGQVSLAIQEIAEWQYRNGDKVKRPDHKHVPVKRRMK